MQGATRRSLIAAWGLLIAGLALASPGFAAVTTLGAPASIAGSTTLAYTVPAGTDRLLVVTASNAAAIVAPTVSFGASPMTLVVQRADTVAIDSMWQLALGSSASETTGTITVTGFASAANTVITAQGFAGVNQATPIDGTNTNQALGSNLASSLALNATTAGDLVYDIFDGFVSSGSVTATPDASQTAVHDVNLTIVNGFGRYRTSTKAATGASTTMSWTSNSAAILHLAANINAAPVVSPTISNVTDQSINEDANTGALPFTIGDPDTPLANLTVTASSSNTTLVPNANLSLGGSGASRNITVTPVADLSGTSTITIEVSDGVNTASDTFLLTVNPVNDLPSFVIGGNVTVAGVTSPVSRIVGGQATAINDGDPDFTQALAFTVTNTNNSLFISPPSIDGSGTLTFLQQANVSGSATVNVNLRDDASAGGPALTTSDQSFTITVTPIGPNLNYTPSATPTSVDRLIPFFNGPNGAGITRSGALDITPVGGSAGATTTLSNCSVNVPGFDVSSLNGRTFATGSGPQTANLTCTSDSTSRNGILSCDETPVGAGTTTRTWPVNCPTCILDVSTTLDTTAPPGTGFVSAVTGTQTGRMNRFAVISTCAAPKGYPGDFDTFAIRQYDAYTFRTGAAQCVTARLRTITGGTAFFVAAYSGSFNPASPGTNYVADPGSSPSTAIAMSFNTAANSDYVIVVHEVNPGGGTGRQYQLQLDACGASADLGITKTDGVTSVNGGTATTYTITANNPGPSPVTGATVADTFPAACTIATWTCAGAGGGTCTAAGSGNINDTVNLPVGASVTYSATCGINPVATGTLVNTATITSPSGTPDLNSANNSATDTNSIVPSANLGITKTDGVSAAVPGGSVTYTITGSNAGPTSVTGATVADTFPASCVSPSWTCVGAGGGTCTAAGSGNINDSVNLPVGGSVTYTAVCPISAAATGTLANTATIAVPVGINDPTPANNSATDSNLLTPRANLGISKTNGVSSVVAGTSTTYTIVASNAGPSDAPNTTVADTFPASLTCAWTCVGAGGGTCTAAGSGNINDTINLPVGASATYTAVCNISAAATGTLSNTATIAVGGGVIDPTPGNNSATDGPDTIISTTYSIAAAAVTEGTGGNTNLQLTVSATPPPAAVGSVNFATSDGTAVAPGDYTSSSGTLVFGIGVATRNITIPINPDNVVEGNETLTVTLSAPVNGVIGTGSAVGTINNDDSATLSINDVAVDEGNAGNTPLSFTISLSNPVQGTVSVVANTADGNNANAALNATLANTDYVALVNVPASIASGTLTSLTAQGVGDTSFENDEQFRVILSGLSIPGTLIPGTVTLGTATGIGTLRNDDLQTTTTTITSDLPDPSVVGQPYPVVVQVAGQASSPAGTVNISDGTGANCSATLSATTSPNSTATCSLTSTSAGAKTLTATYVPGTGFAPSNGGTAHQVNPAATTITLSGPPRVRVNTPTRFDFVLAVTSPGGGSPAGTVTVTSGDASCNLTLPAPAPTGCDLSFTTPGSRSINASFVSADGNYTASATASAVASVVFAVADLAVTKDDGVSTYRPADLLVYTMTLRNQGPDASPLVRFTDVLPGLTNPRWTCAALGGAICPQAGGVSDINATVQVLPSLGQLTYTLSGNVPRPAPSTLSNTAAVVLPPDTTIEDPQLGNQSQTDTNTLAPSFEHGFEAPAMAAASGQVQIPLALRGQAREVASVILSLDDAYGEALRVYARNFDGQWELALALRDRQGLWTLRPWQRASAAPTLLWTTDGSPGQWSLIDAELR